MKFEGRMFFVVGSYLRTNVSESLLLRVPVKEHVGVFHFKRTTGSLSTYLKLVHFLNYAATQPERMIARADDDACLYLS